MIEQQSWTVCSGDGRVVKAGATAAYAAYEARLRAERGEDIYARADTGTEAYVWRRRQGAFFARDDGGPVRGLFAIIGPSPDAAGGPDGTTPCRLAYPRPSARVGALDCRVLGIAPRGASVVEGG